MSGRVARAMAAACACVVGLAAVRADAAAPVVRGERVVVVGHGRVTREALRALAARADSVLAAAEALATRDDSVLFAAGALTTRAESLSAASGVGSPASPADSLPVAGSRTRARRVRVHAWATLEDKALATRSTRGAHADASGVYVSLEPGIPGEFEYVLARRALSSRLGAPARRSVADGLAMRFSARWGGIGARAWAARLARAADGDIALSRILDDDAYLRLTPLLRLPLAAELVAWIARAYGDSLGFALRAGAPPPGDLAARWRRHVQSLARRADSARSPVRRLPEFVRGVCFAHEGYAVRDGYVSRAADRALERARELGANAAAITPFTFMRDPHAPAPLPVPTHAGSETDEAVLHAVRAAHALGLAVMVKPHVWLGRSWPGEIEMASAGEWEAFFGAYEAWIFHVAMLAEMGRAEALCVGTELVAATRGHEARWRQLARRVRALFGGELTYAANWGEEFERLGFWDAFDRAGVDAYYPLSRDSAATDAELRAGADSVVARIERVARRAGVPVLLTEAGFPALPAAWVRPWAGLHHGARSGAAADPVAQARAWGALLAALADAAALGDSPLCGLFVWKWPSYLEDGGPDHAGFTPNGKAAETVVRRFFRDRLP